MADFERVTYKDPSEPWYRVAVAYRSAGTTVELGFRSLLKYARNFGKDNAGNINSLAVVNTASGISYAVGGGHSVDSMGLVAPLPDEYSRQRKFSNFFLSVVDLPDITIGAPRDIGNTRSAEAGAVTQVWVDTDKLSSHPSEAKFLDPNVPPFVLYKAAIRQAIIASWE